MISSNNPNQQEVNKIISNIGKFGTRINNKNNDEIRLMKRANTAQLILNARDNPIQPSDITFEYNRKCENWIYFRVKHYDWWMFPWKARGCDSTNALKYSVLEGDVADLILTTNFVQRYIRSIKCLIDAATIGKVDPVRGVGVSPARYSKIYCSMQYFIKVAQIIDDQQSETDIKKVYNEFISVFHVISGTDQICKVHFM